MAMYDEPDPGLDHDSTMVLIVGLVLPGQAEEGVRNLQAFHDADRQYVRENSGTRYRITGRKPFLVEGSQAPFPKAFRVILQSLTFSITNMHKDHDHVLGLRL